MEPLTPEERLKKAQQASMLALFCVMMGLMVSCGGSVLCIIELPLAGWGLLIAREALTGDDVPDMVRAYAVPARNLLIACLVHSGMMIVFILGIVFLYGGIFAMAIAGGL